MIQTNAKIWKNQQYQHFHYVYKKKTQAKKPAFLAPPVGLEPTTTRLTAECSTDWAKEEYICRRRLIFPGGCPPSIFSTDELNYRVRDGNGWTLIVIDTDLIYAVTHILFTFLTFGDPYEIRTRVAGVRGRSLRPLDQRATIGTPSRARTVDTLIKSQVLYQLS